MKYFEELCTTRLTLRHLDNLDCNDTYLSWLKDLEINRFLETRWYPQSIESIKKFVEDINNSSHSYLFGIIHKDSNKHIGNIKIGPIHEFYSYADISYFIGSKIHWGMGYATEAISTIVQFGFESLNLNRIQAGVFGSNKGSIKALLKAGFVKEGIFRKQLYTKDFCDDHIFYGILQEDWIKN